MTTVTSLVTLQAFVGLISSFIVGPIIDRLGRKWAMVVSLAVNGIGYILMSQASTFPVFAVLMSISGAFNPIYRVGADAMMADLIPPEDRVEAYSLMRMSNNVGIAVGPAIGGFIASTSYTITFFIAATCMLIYCALIAFFAHETLPTLDNPEKTKTEKFGGYSRVFQDHPFIQFIFIFVASQICATVMWVMLAVYAKENFQVPESQYGFIPMTNALMVVFFQIYVTNITKVYKPLRVLAVGALFYGFGVGSVALGYGFWGFWLSMVIMTIGELIIMPTSQTYAANLAPADMRGRYMSLYGLSWGMASGIGPFMGGILSDHFGPRSPWLAAFVAGLFSSFSFIYLAKRKTPSSLIKPRKI